jgi:hypothetical protein
MTMIESIRTLPMLYAVARLQIADHLADGPQSADELAAHTGAYAQSLYRVLRALATFNVFMENARGQFEMTPLAEFLRSDVPNSMRQQVLWTGAPYRWHARGELLHTVMTGETAFQHIHGMGVFEYLARHPDAAALFNDAMSAMTATYAEAAASAYDFGIFDRAMDVGGGHGTLMITLLNRFPDLHGGIFDLSTVVEGTVSRLEAAGLLDRCDLVSGSFFEAVPSGYDAYILKDIIHDWNDEDSLTILRNCHAAMNSEARLLIIERVIPPGNEPFVGKMVDITMLVETGGMERTAEQYQDLLAAAGFRIERIIPTSEASSIIEAIPV